MSLKENILKFLLENTDTYISGQQLAENFGVSRNSVWKAVNQIKADGYTVDSVSNRGYRLSAKSDVLSGNHIKSKLHGEAEELNVIVLDSVDSTNNEAKRMTANGCDRDTLIIANEQTGGRGRLGRIQAAAGKNEPRRQPEAIEIFTWSAMLDDAPPEIRDAYVQREPLLSWASEHLDESLRYALLSAVKGGIREKRELLVKEVIPKYMLRAGGIVTATSFVTVPFTDSVALTGLQTLMAGEIIRFFGIDSDVKDVAKGLAGASLVSYCGRTLSTQLISLIPVVNGAVKTAVNLSVAVSLTGTLGAAMAYLCEQYLTFCVDLNGKANLPFSDFLTEERILAAMKLVQGSLGKDGERVSGKTTAKELAQYFVKQMLNDLMKGSGWKS